VGLSKVQIEHIGDSIFASPLGWLAFDSLALLASAVGITTSEDKREMLERIKTATKAREGLARYASGTEYRCLVGITIHPRHDAVPLSFAGQAWELFWSDGKPAKFNKKKITWE